MSEVGRVIKFYNSFFFVNVGGEILPCKLRGLLKRDKKIGSAVYVGSVTSQESTQAEGTIIAQYPSPDAEVELGSKVDLVVAKRAEPKPEPQPEPVHEPEPEPQRQSTETQPAQSEFPEIPVDVPDREGDRQKER